MPVPEDSRPPVPEINDERAMVESFLEFQRATLLWKCAGLSDEQLRSRTVPPSTMSLLGLVRHMTEVETSWFLRGFAGRDVPIVYWLPGNNDGDFDDVDGADVAKTFADYEAVVAACRSAVADASLEDGFTRARDGVRHQLRWVYLHMIEEYARHNGHADLLRERVDGATGE